MKEESAINHIVAMKQRIIAVAIMSGVMLFTSSCKDRNTHQEKESPPSAGKIQKWESKVIFLTGTTPQELTNYLTNEGSNGWELATMSTEFNSAGKVMFWVGMKRPRSQ